MPISVLTTSFVNRAACAPGVRKTDFFDRRCQGLLLEVRRSGGKTFYVRYRDLHGRERRFKIGPPDAAAVEKATKSFRTQAKVLNNHLKNRKWLVGEQLSVADFSVAVTLPYAAKAEMPLDEFPEVRRWHDQLSALDGWLDPFPQRS